ncbi:MAG: homoserine kinase [Bacillaceae bacterium]|nr:homoserine kinase [Bacillaceae bacterium]
MNDQAVYVRVPASTANLGSGFDSIGMAFQLYTTIKMRVAEQTVIQHRGPHLEGIPTDKSNLIYKAVEKVFHVAGKPVPELEIEVESEIPLTRGLGSSAAALVGGLVAGNQLAGNPLDQDELYQIASVWEGHPDNVGASLYGGIIIGAMDGDHVSHIRVSPPPLLKAVVAIPDFQLSTRLARSVLPTQYAREDVVYSVSHAALLAAALSTGDTSVLAKAMQDRIHQPYRMTLVPGMEKLLKNAVEYGALGVALSGAGPTVIALVEGEEESLKQYMADVFAQEEIRCEVKTLLPDLDGVLLKSMVDTQEGA